jgi:hypothetical protein
VADGRTGLAHCEKCNNVAVVDPSALVALPSFTPATPSYTSFLLSHPCPLHLFLDEERDPCERCARRVEEEYLYIIIYIIHCNNRGFHFSTHPDFFLAWLSLTAL